jgi:uncharacterized membrane-anchored protein
MNEGIKALPGGEAMTMDRWMRVCRMLMLVLTMVAVGPAMAEGDAPAAAKDPRAAVMAQAMSDARTVAVDGPGDIALADQGTLHLPAGRVWIPQPQAGRLLNAMGNPGQDPRLLGLIFPKGEGEWFVTLRFEKSGYVKDDDARDWNADDLLKSYRDGTEAANAEREKIGVKPIEIIGWAERPAYDAATHRLVWAMSLRDKGAADDAPQGVNYNTYALGREGYFSLDLITDRATLARDRGAAQALLAALDYQPGKSYADFKAETDHVAEYGLAALVVGVAAKKLGLLALGGLFIAKFFKVILIGLAVLGGGAARIFGRRKAAPAMETSIADTPAATAVATIAPVSIPADRNAEPIPPRPTGGAG